MESSASSFSSESDDDDDETNTPAPRSSKRERRPFEDDEHGNTASGPKKVRRISVGQKISRMAGYVRDMANTLRLEVERRESKAREPKLPVDFQERAIAILKQDAAFSDNEMMVIIDFFMVDRNLARLYTAISSRRRTVFLQYQLAKLRALAK